MIVWVYAICLLYYHQLQGNIDTHIFVVEIDHTPTIGLNARQAQGSREKDITIAQNKANYKLDKWLNKSVHVIELKVVEGVSLAHDVNKLTKQLRDPL